MKATSRRNGYGPVESENERVGTVDAESPEAKADDHGLAALKKRKRGGKVEGNEPRHRMDRPHRAHGGKVAKKGTTVNVIVAPQGGAPAGGMPSLGAPTGGPPMPPPGAMPPPRPPVAGPPVGMPPPGAAPMMPRKDGGRVYRAQGGATEKDPFPEAIQQALNDQKPRVQKEETPGRYDDIRNRGGAVRKDGGRVHMTAGAGSGGGREQKIREYGANARSGEGK